MSESAERLKSFVARIERLEEDKANIAQDIKDVLTEAESDGFDKKALRSVIRLRKIDRAEREAMDALLDTYLSALEGID